MILLFSLLPSRLCISMVQKKKKSVRTEKDSSIYSQKNLSCTLAFEKCSYVASVLTRNYQPVLTCCLLTFFDSLDAMFISIF